MNPVSTADVPEHEPREQQQSDPTQAEALGPIQYSGDLEGDDQAPGEDPVQDQEDLDFSEDPGPEPDGEWPVERLDEQSIEEEEGEQERLDRALSPGPELEESVRLPTLGGPRRGKRKGRRLSKPEDIGPIATSPERRLLILDVWRRSGLAAGDFSDIVGVSKHSLYNWKKRFDNEGPAGLMDRPKGGPRGSRLSDLTKRTILMLKEEHPDWGCERISNMLMRGPALPASATAVARVLHEAGYQFEEKTTHRHPDKVRRFERARPNQLWQTDLFTFTLKRQNRRVYLVAFMDDHSRFITGFGLHGGASTALVIDVLRSAITNFGPPEEILTDNGPQYVTWRGKSAFRKELDKLGIQQIVAKPRRPQTLGKIERFWGTLWRDLLQAAIFTDMDDARTRIGHFIDYYNFKRPHMGIEKSAPADRFFQAAEEVKRTLKARVADNALHLARHGMPKEPFYVTGNVGGKPFSLHAEGERIVMTDADGKRKEVDMNQPAQKTMPQPQCTSAQPPDGEGEPGCCPPAEPGTSTLDEGLKALEAQANDEEVKDDCANG